MDEESFNQSIRKFLKVVGVTTQREIEKSVRAAIAAGDLKNVRELDVHASITLDKFGVVTETDGKIALTRDATQDQWELH